ncbi:MAG: DUF748 domain-containing protein, partial [Planctomycetota bacterium]
ADLRLEELGVEVTDFALGGEEPAALTFRLEAPGLVESLTVRGTVAGGPEGGSADLEMTAEGITAKSASPYLAAAGVESLLTGGALRLALVADAKLVEGGIDASAHLSDLSFEDGDVQLVGLDEASVEGVTVRPEGTRVGSIELKRARARVVRAEDGALDAAGFRMEASGAAPGRAVTLTPVVSASVWGLFIGEDPRPFGFRALAEIGEGKVRIEGDASLSAGGASTSAEIDAEGIGPDPLSAFLPPGMAITLADGRLEAKVVADVEAHPDGGSRAKLHLLDVVLRDGPGPDSDPLLLLGPVRAVVARAEPGKRIALDEISVGGLVATVRKSADGTVHLPGFALVPVAEAAPTEASPPADEPEQPTPPVEAERPRLKLPENPPLVTLEKLDVGLARLTYLDESQPGAEPMVVSDLRLRNRERIECLGEDAEGRPPIALELTGGVAPFLDSLLITATLAPFAAEPEATVEIALDGVRGPKIPEAFPALAESIDARGLEDGRFRARLMVTLLTRRRGPLDFDLGSGFGLSATLDRIELRDGEGPVLVGLDELAAEVSRIDPTTGDVTIKRLGIVKPRGSIVRTKDGLRVAGLLLKQKPPPEEVVAEETPSPPAPAPAETEPGPEIRVDLLSVAGMDFRFEDHSADPPMRMPIRDLDLEVQGFTTRGLTEDVPIRFLAFLRSGEVPLPLEESERRDAFEEITVAGRLSLAPKLDGWVRTSLTALELSNFRGPAASSGVELVDGMLDVGSDLRFKEDGSLDVQTRVVLTDLDLSEPADGPISRYLRLPAPLDAVIFVLRDETGAIEIPLDLHIEPDGISTGEIAEVAITTLGTLIANALASSPFRVAGTVTGALGLGEEEEEPEEPPLALPFDSGTTALDKRGRSTVAGLRKRLAKEADLVLTLTHEAGRGDVDIAGRRVNPSPEESRALVERLRRRKAGLLRERANVHAHAQAAFAAGLEVKATRSSAELGAIDSELGMVERALDDVLALLRPGSERRAPRRTREACVAIGNRR